MATFKVRSFFPYCGLNQHLQTCLRKKRDEIATATQPASSRAINNLQNTTAQQHKRDCL